MVIITSVIKRPNTETNWLPPEITGWYLTDQHYLDTWHEKGRLLSATYTEVEGELTATSVRTFIDWQAYYDFSSDPGLQATRNKRDDYTTNMDIELLSVDMKEV